MDSLLQRERRFNGRGKNPATSHFVVLNRDNGHKLMPCNLPNKHFQLKEAL
ncbi:conserved hypothetical protein [Ricinus communis]|uniref:Uncharacterized protein n=1 Tax=Ricinus communis TaxID=3988 RepID=B9S5C9_RICCO|nr:conserved hypothetical protein [Ricinus communis]